MIPITCLSIRNPLSWLVVAGIKDVENRSWSTHHRDWLYIHSSGTEAKGDGLIDERTPILLEYQRFLGGNLSLSRSNYIAEVVSGGPVRWEEGYRSRQDLAEINMVDRLRDAGIYNLSILRSRAIVGRVRILEVAEGFSGSTWASDDRYQWKLRDAELFAHPIEGVKGKLGLWRYDLPVDDLAAALARKPRNP